MECDTAKVGELLPVYWFQSTHPHGVRLHPKRCIYTYRRVSIHAPAWGATFITHPDSLFKSFNPRTRMGCDYDYLAQMRFETVSIHAPAWGATIYLNNMTKAERVSIHAPAWGATQHQPTTFYYTCGFNPRTRMGCDQCRPYASGTIKVSIHAPAWGATNPQEFTGSDGVVSIHAPAWGATDVPLSPVQSSVFQSTHPHGVRLGVVWGAAPHAQRFNPRTRMGCDSR